jgi:hypothetical protein
MSKYDHLTEKLGETARVVPVRWVEMLIRIADQLASTDVDSEVEIVVIETDHLKAVTKARHRVPVLWDSEYGDDPSKEGP